MNWSGRLTGDSTTAKMTAAYTLQKLEGGTYRTVAAWSGFSTTSTLLICSGSYTGTTGTYKLIINATITSKSGAVEYVTDYLIKTL